MPEGLKVKLKNIVLAKIKTRTCFKEDSPFYPFMVQNLRDNFSEEVEQVYLDLFCFKYVMSLARKLFIPYHNPNCPQHGPYDIHVELAKAVQNHVKNMDWEDY